MIFSLNTHLLSMSMIRFKYAWTFYHLSTTLLSNARKYLYNSNRICRPLDYADIRPPCSKPTNYWELWTICRQYVILRNIISALLLPHGYLGAIAGKPRPTPVYRCSMNISNLAETFTINRSNIVRKKLKISAQTDELFSR